MGSASSSRSKASTGSGAKEGAEGSSHARPSKGAAVTAAAAAGECTDCVDCGHCKFMKAGPCCEQYAKAHDCVKEAMDADKNPDQVCSDVVQDLGKCIIANRAYHHCLRSFSERYVDDDGAKEV